MTCRDIPLAESMACGSRKSKTPGMDSCDDMEVCREGMQEDNPQEGYRFG